MYTIVAILPDNLRYEVARDVAEDILEETLVKLSKQHVYRYARFVFWDELDDSED